MQLNSHETPRRRGRNNKGRLASARLRQVKKSQQNLRRSLKSE
jgi:hypothetical protein